MPDLSLSVAWKRLYAFFIDSGFKLLSRANSSKAAFLAFRAATTDCPVGGAAEAEAPGAPMRPPPPNPAGGCLPPVTISKNSVNETWPSPSESIMRIISSTSSSVTCSPILMSTCRISAAPTKLFLSRSNAVKASQISSSVNLPFGSRAGPAWAAPTSFAAPASLLI